MAKNKSGFIQLRNDIVECPAFDIIQAVIICKIASWQREKRKFFQSKQEIAKEFKVDWKTINRRMNELEDMGVIVRRGKVKRSTVYEVNALKLETYLSGMNQSGNIPERNESSRKHTREVDYNTNNKTSNKTSFIEEGTSGVPSSKDKKARISEDAINALAKDIDID